MMKKMILVASVCAVMLSFAARAEETTSVGVKECDDYLTKVTACVSKNVPENMRTTFNQSVESTKKSWVELAKNETTKTALADACKQAMGVAKESFKAYNCTFD